MRIWLDDLRPMPEGFTRWVKTPLAATKLIMTNKVEHISFDHDLGLPDPDNGYRVAAFIELQAYLGNVKRFTWAIHSANPVGRDNITAAMQSAERYWERQS